MGKYPHSRLHDVFSNWHWKKCASASYLTDIDRLWMELRGTYPAAVFDLKTGADDLTWAGEVAGNWFEEKKVPFFIVHIGKVDSKRIVLDDFTITRPKTNHTFHMMESQMIQWIDALYAEQPAIETIKTDDGSTEYFAKVYGEREDDF